MKIFKIIIALLTLVVIDSTSAIGQKVRKDFRFREKARREFIANNLNLTPDQKARVAELRAARYEANKERITELKSLRHQKRQVMGEENPNLDTVNQIVDKISLLRADIQKENIRFGQELKSLLTEAQRETLKEGKKLEKWYKPRRPFKPRSKFRY